MAPFRIGSYCEWCIVNGIYLVHRFYYHITPVTGERTGSARLDTDCRKRLARLGLTQYLVKLSVRFIISTRPIQKCSYIRDSSFLICRSRTARPLFNTLKLWGRQWHDRRRQGHEGRRGQAECSGIVSSLAKNKKSCPNFTTSPSFTSKNPVTRWRPPSRTGSITVCSVW